MASSASVPPLKVFISYSHRDMDVKQEIERYLLSHSKVVEVLSDNLLSPGVEWSKVLTGIRNEADVFLLLVSDAYVHSETVRQELQHVISRVKNESVYIIPFILERCEWQLEEYSVYQAMPKFGKPFNEISDKKETLQELTEALLHFYSIKQNSRASQLIKTEKEAKTGMLNLTDCSLEIIPRDLLDMPWLTTVCLDQNHIGKIEHLENLIKLETLTLTQNRIEIIENLDNLVNLDVLDLKHNQISVITNLEHNIKLGKLGLSSNNLSSLNGIGHLKNLESLYASHNHIQNIDELEQLPQLKRIVLTNNQLQSVKPLLYHIRTLPVLLKYSFNESEEGIFIKDNTTLSEPSLEVIAKGNDAILKYFDDADIYGTCKLEIIKLILVGNSSVGKTNLCEFLRKVPRTATHNSTDLLDIHAWDANFLSVNKDKPLRINIFDFGGQDYYHDSHRLYYSHDTAYVLMWDTTTNKYETKEEPTADGKDLFVYENYPLEYWLQSINYNLTGKAKYTYKDTGGQQPDKAKPAANNPPVLVLQNKIDIAEGRLDQQMLTMQYNNIAGFFNVSLAVPKRTEALPGVLGDYMNALNLSGRQLIKYEYRIIEEFLFHPRAFAALSLDEFWEECKRIINDKSVDFNRDNARIIAEIMNATGIVFYDGKSSEEGVIFTQITLLNELIKKVMDVAKRGNDKGEFRRSQLSDISYCNEVLQLLTQNKSIIAIDDDRFLVPQFLPLRPDPSVEFFLNAFTYTQVRFLYKAYFHKTLLLSLFANYMGNNSTKGNMIVKTPLYWRNGIIIQCGEAMVFVEFKKEESCGIINIKTMKPYNKRGLEKEIEVLLEQLNQGWTVVKEISTNSRDFFAIDELNNSIKNGIYEFAKNGSVFSANDFKLIADFDMLPVKLFISYSQKNGAFVQRFITHLEVLKSAGIIEPWYDRMIESGTRWDETIRKEMSNSDIIIFLLSPDFLATEYIMKTEIPLAAAQSQNGGKFFFIELQPCGWKRTVIASYQQTDDSRSEKKDVIQIGKPDNDDKWNEVIEELVVKMKK